MVTFRVHGRTINDFAIAYPKLVPHPVASDAHDQFSYITPLRNFEVEGRVVAHEEFLGYYTPVSFHLLCWYAAYWQHY